MSHPRIAIVGGGILGVTAAYRLARAGVRPILFERGSDLGGLAGSFDFDGSPADRFYHVVLPRDDRVLGLMDEVGLGGEIRFRPTKVGFFGDHRFCSMDSVREFATFPLLRARDRVRLAAFVTGCQIRKSHETLDTTPLVPWLQRTSGRGPTERLWVPLLDSKFDGRYDDLPATYIWARTRRMSGARDRSGREVMGWIKGGYQRLIERVAERAVGAGAEIRTNCDVQRIVGDESGVAGLVVDGQLEQYEFVLCTLTPPQRAALLDERLIEVLQPDRRRYLGVVCVVLRTAKSISPYYTLNITDRSIPLTTIVETTHVVDPAAAGGHLVYIARYLDPSSSDFQLSPAQLETEYLARARRIFPHLTDEVILARRTQAARIAEPVHPIGTAGTTEDGFPVPGLAFASTADVYPDNVNGQAVIAIADVAVQQILTRVRGPRLAAA